MLKFTATDFCPFLKEQICNPSLPPACQTQARYYRVLPSNKHGHALILENQHTHIAFFYTNTLVRARTLMQSFFVTLFSVLQRITQQIQREFDRSLIFFLSVLSVFICFKGLLCDASENMAHCRGLGANNSRQAVKKGSPTSAPTTSNSCGLLRRIAHRKVQVPYPNLPWHVFEQMIGFLDL